MENNYTMCKVCGQELGAGDKFCPNCGAMTENMPAICQACGAELTASDNFCPNCGAQRNAPKKKPATKKWWILAIVLVVVLAVAVIIGVSGGSSDTASEPVSMPVTPVEPAATAAPAATVAPPAAADSKVTNEKVDTLITLLEMTIPENFDYYEIEGDENGVTISVAIDGIAEGIVSAKSIGLDDSFEPWAEAKDSMVTLCNTICDTAETIGLDDISITLTVLNDLNYDNVLLVIMDGYVLYDIMAE